MHYQNDRAAFDTDIWRPLFEDKVAHYTLQLVTRTLREVRLRELQDGAGLPPKERKPATGLNRQGFTETSAASAETDSGARQADAGAPERGDVAEKTYEPTGEPRRMHWFPAIASIFVLSTVTIGKSSPLTATVLTVAGLLTLAIIVWRAREVRILLDESRLTIQHIYLTRRIKRSEIGRVVLVPQLSEAGVNRNAMLMLIGKNGRKLTRLFAPYWPWSSLEDMAARLGAPVWVADKPVSHTGLAGSFPKAIRWSDRHPALFELMIAAGTLALTALIVLFLVSVAVPLDG